MYMYELGVHCTAKLTLNSEPVVASIVLYLTLIHHSIRVSNLEA